MADETLSLPETEAQSKLGAVRSLTRRGFLGAASIGAAGIGLMSSAPAMTLLGDSTEAAPEEVPAAAMAEPLVIQVRDFAAGEMSIMSGLKEVIVKDPQLVMKLVRAAAR